MPPIGQADVPVPPLRTRFGRTRAPYRASISNQVCSGLEIRTRGMGLWHLVAHVKNGVPSFVVLVMPIYPTEVIEHHQACRQGSSAQHRLMLPFSVKSPGSNPILGCSTPTSKQRCIHSTEVIFRSIRLSFFTHLARSYASLIERLPSFCSTNI